MICSQSVIMKFNMENLIDRKLQLLVNIGKVVKSIDDEVDWYIASFSEKETKRKLIARNIYMEKHNERVCLAKEMYGKYR